jgi:hypothetical protein
MGIHEGPLLTEVVTLGAGDGRALDLMAIYAGGHFHLKHWLDRSLLPYVAVTLLTFDFRGGVFGVAEEDEVGEDIDGLFRGYFGIASDGGVTGLAGRCGGKGGALGGLSGGVAIDALQLQRRVALVVELDRICGETG